MPMNYERYQDEVTSDIKYILDKFGCQPILFIGSGFSRRYANAPNWDDLLRKLATYCPNITKDYAYYKQTYQDLPMIAGIFVEAYKEWAWSSGRDFFPVEFFDATYPADIFIKYAAVKVLSNLDLMAVEADSSFQDLNAEILALKTINPHAIITTNYDSLLEPLFPEYESIVGQKILMQSYLSIGEIFKIHGCISDPMSLVLTDKDYEIFDADKKYLSAKLLTYFAEHPLLFIGYSATDSNVRSILDDVNRMIRSGSDLIENIYILEWSSSIDEFSYPARDRVLSIGENREIRIKSISASSFEWVYKAFGSGGALKKVNMKLLRSLLARTVELVRKDAPTRKVDIDFQTLEHKLNSAGGDVATLLGITTISDPAKFNIRFPFTLTEVSEKLGYQHWSYARKLFDRIKEKIGVDILSFDNSYQITVLTGKASGSKIHKYSQECIDLLKDIRDGKEFVLAENCYPVIP